MSESSIQYNDVARTDPQTLVRWITDQQRKTVAGADGSLSVLLSSISVACKFVASAVGKAALAGLLGLAGSSNVQGEDQKKLDILANEVFSNMLAKSGQCSALVSEENDDLVVVEEAYRGPYCVVMDPLDGSSNIDCGVSIGTIFGIYRAQPGSSGCLEDVLRPGKEMVAAGYCMYGNNCCMVLSIGSGTNIFTLDPSIGEFVLTSANIQIPSKGSIYSINEGNEKFWQSEVSRYVRECKYPSDGPPKSLRYVGSMVADVHRTILYGGLFLYPADSKTTSGKLRLLYECFPMAYLVEQAGGLATTGTQRILDIVPTQIHERRPIFLGSKEDVHRVEVLHDHC
ncbi:Fructose-1,6-bisphosphatase, cytosolic [Trebouxia sp. C0009 RCD-2024]